MIAAFGPSRLTVHEVGADYVLGSFRDEYDVEYVRLYDLARPGGAGAAP
jgi:hypothetical protein